MCLESDGYMIGEVRTRRSSLLSIKSENSVLCIASRGSILSIASVGSVLSIGSIGSFLSAFSVSSFASVASVMSAVADRSVLSWRPQVSPKGRRAKQIHLDLAVSDLETADRPPATATRACQGLPRKGFGSFTHIVPFG